MMLGHSLKKGIRKFQISFDGLGVDQFVIVSSPRCWMGAPGEKAVRCASCGGQSVGRVGDVGFGCTCAKSKK